VEQSEEKKISSGQKNMHRDKKSVASKIFFAINRLGINSMLWKKRG
jgi:hypothetical protein